MSIDIIYNFVIALAGVAGIIAWPYLSKTLKIVAALTWIAFIVEMLSKYVLKDGFKGIAYHLYTIIEFGSLGYVFISNIRVKDLKTLFKFICFIGIASIILLPIVGSFLMAQQYDFYIESSWAICLTAVFFIQIIRDDEYIELKTYPLFWVAVGIFMFYVGNLLLFSSVGYLYKLDPVLAKNIFLWINRGLNILMYFMFLVGFLCKHPSIMKRFL
jgi:hypothetical protein